MKLSIWLRLHNRFYTIKVSEHTVKHLGIVGRERYEVSLAETRSGDDGASRLKNGGKGFLAMMPAIETSMGMCSLCPAFRMLLLLLLPDRSLRLPTLSRTASGWVYSSVQFPIEEKSYKRLMTLRIGAKGKGPDDTIHEGYRLSPFRMRVWRCVTHMATARAG